MLKTTVVMCTYNGHAFIKDQLLSIADQTRQVDQIYISDDCSTDATIEVIQGLKPHLPATIVKVNGHNHGYAQNFSNALQDATGDIVFLCDQDDLWDRDKVSSYAKIFEDNPEIDLVYSDLGLIDESAKSLGTTFWSVHELASRNRRNLQNATIHRHIFEQNLLTGATMAFRQYLVASISPIPQGIPHDYWIALVSAARPGTLHAMSKPLTFYRVHGGQTIGLAQRIDAPHDWAQLYLFYCTQVNVWKTLHDRVQAFSDREYLKRIQKKLYHSRLDRLHAMRRRRARNSDRKRGLRIVLEEIVSLRYKYSRGFLSICRDIWAIVCSAD